MGKPAARIADTTAHGGTIAGPGIPNVLIGKMPVATLGDMQVCPMCNGPVPHVGGPITLGSTGVYFGKKPASRISDLCVCAGPPSMPVVGHFQTLIGEIGGAGSGSEAAMAATAASAVTHPGSVKPMDVPEETLSNGENHQILAVVVDSAGYPLAIPYEVKDPNGAMLRGVSTVQGRIWHGGYAAAGGYEVRLKTLTQCRISSNKVKPGDKVQIEVAAEGFTADETISFAVLWKTSQGERLHDVLSAKVQGHKAKVDYTLPLDCGSTADLKSNSLGYEVSEFWVMARSGQWITLSTPTKIETKAQAELWCGKKPVAGAKVQIKTLEGRAKECQSDGSGKIKFSDLSAGCFELEISQNDEMLFTGFLQTDSVEPVRIAIHRPLTIKALAEKLLEIEGKEGFAAARDAAQWLDYLKLNAIAKIGDAKNDPNLMPSRFMLLQGVTDAVLNGKNHLDAWPLKVHASASHRLTVENLALGLNLMGYATNEVLKQASNGLVEKLYLALLAFLNHTHSTQKGSNLKAWTYAVSSGDRLSEIASRFGEASWETVMAANQSAIKENPDSLLEGSTLSMLEREHPWTKWFEDEGYDPVHLGGIGYHYPWKYLSLTLAESLGQSIPETDFPMDVSVCIPDRLGKTTNPPLYQLTLQKAEEIFVLVPRDVPLEIRTSKATYVFAADKKALGKPESDDGDSEADSNEQNGLSPEDFQAKKVTLV